ncbi:hypothetical protein LSS_01702 [Leptospira santarosai serovar Shermani str. LT 821]|uniref:Uncharacterized protein n=1 Tax=Leptospira santarosai serovar Shermani str. LT 821 TaxID=758847 RepID=K8Y6E8_9LEPT|nr:hypothetical protein LSS_01702 [Leptospira santarosai serovar Shermani str. LT 821]
MKPKKIPQSLEDRISNRTDPRKTIRMGNRKR